MSLTVLNANRGVESVTVRTGSDRKNRVTRTTARAFSVTLLASGVARTALRQRVTITQRGELPPEIALGQVFATYDAASITANDGDRISTWTDTSGNGHDLTQATADKQPAYVADAINGKPGLRFANSRGDALLSDVFAAMPEPATVLMVVVTPETTPAATQYLLEGSSGTARRGFFLTSSRRPGLAGEVTLPEQPGILADGSPFILSGVFDGAASRIRINGASWAQDIADGQSPTRLTVGGRWDTTQGWDGIISAIVVYNRELTEGQLRRAEENLAERYGLLTSHDQTYYVDAVAGNDLYSGRLPSTPKTSLASAIAAYGSSTDPCTIYVTAPQATPLREQASWSQTATLTIAGTDGTPWYHYGSEQFTTGWSGPASGVYSRAVTGYLFGCEQVLISTLANGDGHWTRLTKNTATPTTPAAGEYGIDVTGGDGTLYVRLPGDADPNSHTIEAGKQSFCFWARSAARVTISDARWYAANVACHRTGGTAGGDDGDTVTTDCEAWYGGIHGGFATATGTWTSAVYEDCTAIAAMNDGFNIHGSAGAQHAIQRRCIGAYCGDEGWSAHDDTESDDYDGVYHHNGSGGATHVDSAHGIISGTELYENQRTNVGTDSGGLVLLNTASYTATDLYSHDNPYEGIKVFSTATLTQSGTRSGTEEGNGLADNLSA